jgi:hypothetical protein
MAWAGLILSFLGVFFGAVSAYYAHITYQRDHAPQHGGAAYPGSRHTENRRGSRLWKFGIVAAVFTLAIGVLLIIHPGGSSPRHPLSQPTYSSSPQQSSPVSGGDGSPTSAGWQMQWGPGTLLLSDNVNDNLDDVPPDVTGNAGGGGALLYSGQFVSDSNGVVSWTGNETGTATAAACATLVSTHGVQGVNVMAGHTYCFKTDGGNIAILTPLQATVKQDGSMPTALVRVTTWNSGS